MRTADSEPRIALIEDLLYHQTIDVTPRGAYLHVICIECRSKSVKFCVRGFELPNMTAMMRQMIRTLTYFEYRINNNAYLYIQ